MKLLIEPSSKNNLYLDSNCGIILALDEYSVESISYYTVDEIIDIKSKRRGEVFVKINKNLFNNEIDEISDILKKLDGVVDGVFFYDLALLQIKNELGLGIELIWNQTHMVNNYITCDYYYDKGVKYALLSKEITLDEIKEIIKLSKITCMVEVVSRPSVAFSKRSLLTNYYKDLGKSRNNVLKIHEKVSGEDFCVIEDDNGTCFYLDKITNGTSIIKDLYDIGCNYIIFREYGIDNFRELVNDTVSYINCGCLDDEYISKYKKLGDSTNFFFKKTIYKVK